MREIILESVEAGLLAIEQLKSNNGLDFIQKLASEMAKCFQRGNKLLIAGNGGSLCDAAHFAEELTGQFRKQRAALPAIALNDPGFITCTGNDFGFETIFARGVAALGNPGDLFIGLTTSGNSQNLVKAFHQAQEKDLKTVAFLGKDGGALKGVADLELIITGFKTSDRIQEAHMTAIHIAIEAMEHELFYDAKAPYSSSLSFLPTLKASL